jgi:hypothetical protein
MSSRTRPLRVWLPWTWSKIMEHLVIFTYLTYLLSTYLRYLLRHAICMCCHIKIGSSYLPTYGCLRAHRSSRTFEIPSYCSL